MSENPSPISIIQRLHELDLFFVTTRTLADLFELPPARVYRLVTQLRQLGLLAEVENGKYLVLGFEPERVLANPLFIASQLATPGYVSFWSALHYYGFTEQAPLTVFVATTVKKRPVVYRDQRFRFVTLQPRKLAANQADAQFLRRTLETVDRHLSDFEFDVDTLARKLAVSRRQLFRKLGAITGGTPHALIRSMRLKRAAQLLQESQMTVTEITYAVGFSDLKHFRTVFKEQFGVLPGDYAKTASS